MQYANGGISQDPDVILYGLCKAFNALPSQLEREDPTLIEKLAYIDYVVSSTTAAKIKAEARRARD
mgnify:FL=1